MTLSFRDCSTFSLAGDELAAYVQKLGWDFDTSSGVVTVTPNPDNQIESTVVQENIQLSRGFYPSVREMSLTQSEFIELVKVITHSQTA